MAVQRPNGVMNINEPVLSLQTEFNIGEKQERKLRRFVEEWILCDSRLPY
jgi:hypothetical protein